MRSTDELSPSIDALASQVQQLDTPYQAWAAVALTSAAEERHRRLGLTLGEKLLAGIPEEMEHADLACYAVLSSFGHPSHARVQESLPFPHVQAASRSRLFNSPLYVYLIARGNAKTGNWIDALLPVVDVSARGAASIPQSDLLDLVLQIATLVELRGGTALDDDLLRLFHARVVTATALSTDVIALRWFLESYQTRWPLGDEADRLRAAIEGFVSTNFPLDIDTSELRSTAIIMLLEIATAKGRMYQFIPTVEVERQVGARLGRHRVAAAIAYSLVICGGLGFPVVRAVHYKGLQGWLGLASFVALVIPTVTWAVLSLYVRPRRVEALTGALILGAGYYATIMYAAWSGHKRLLAFLGGDDAIWTVIAELAAVIGATIFAWRER